MPSVDQKQVSQLIEDLAHVKSAIRKNSSILRYIAFTRTLRLVLILGGMLYIALGVAFHLVIDAAGSFAAVPPPVKTTLFTAIGASIVLLGLLKWSRIKRDARRVDPAISSWRLMREFHSTGIVLSLHVPVGLLMLFLIGYVIAIGQFSLIVPIFAISMGILWNSYAGLLHSNLFYLGGYWFLITGVAALVTTVLSPWLEFSVSIGLGLLLMGVVSHFARATRE